MSDDTQADTLMGHVNAIMRALLVAAKRGAPAEGQLPFNPLYFNILRVVGARGRVRPSQIADELSVSRTTISTAVKALQRRGLLDVSADASDRRALHLTLSAAGKATRDAILRQDKRNAAAMLETLAPSERDAFVTTMGTVARGLSGLPAENPRAGR